MLSHQLASSFLTDAGNPLHVVAGVSHQRQYINDLIRAYAEFFLHSCRVIPDAVVARVKDGHSVVHELEEIFVACNQYYVKTCGGCLDGDCPDHVVCFESLARHYGHAEHLAGLVDPGNLFHEVFWHRAAVSFIVVGQFMAEGGASQVECGSDQLRLFHRNEFP